MFFSRIPEVCGQHEAIGERLGEISFSILQKPRFLDDLQCKQAVQRGSPQHLPSQYRGPSGQGLRAACWAALGTFRTPEVLCKIPKVREQFAEGGLVLCEQLVKVGPTIL